MFQQCPVKWYFLLLGHQDWGAAKCIESHTFGSGEHTIQLKPRCEGGCSEKKPEDGDKCVMKSETSGPVLIFLSGVCQNYVRV
uniref:Putative secreted protein n=1 Tax=Ixodes ricinus TaxID=34613 RepID=V5HAP3_IXORI